MKLFCLSVLLIFSNALFSQSDRTQIGKYGTVELYYIQSNDLGNYASLMFRNQRFPDKIDYASITLGNKEKIQKCIDALNKSIENAPEKIEARFHLGSNDFIYTYDFTKKIYLQTDRKHTNKEPYTTINVKNAVKLVEGLNSILEML